MHIQERIDRLVEHLKQDAVDLESASRIAGEHGDRGASRLRDQVKFFNYGREGKVPPDWERRYGHMLDDEWAEYVRLSKKFQGI